jgi:hypothetical protein
LNNIPDEKDLTHLWATIARQSMRPTLSNAIIRITGTLPAALISRQGENLLPSPSSSLENWGDMMADAGLDDKVRQTSTFCNSHAKKPPKQ